jgi:hypothetical protein
VLSTRQREDTLRKRVETLLIDAGQMGFTPKDVVACLRKCAGDNPVRSRG